MIRVAVADDQAVVRMGLRVLIEREDDLDLVDEAADGRAALDLVRRARPDVLLLDIRMPGMDGLETLRAITADPALRTTRVVIVTTFEIDDYIAEALALGASGFILKDAPPADLLRAIRVAAVGEALLSPSVTRRVVALFGRRVGGSGAPPQGIDQLTEREREVVAWAATGRSNEEIADALCISPDTIRTHLSRAMGKMRARDRTQLVVFAIRAGLILAE